jgi:small subunit ribosomal protein S6
MSQTTTKNKYKATFILDTRGYEEPVETIVDKLKELLSSIGCNVRDVQNIGQLNFVRVTDRKFPAGIYIQIKYDGPSESTALIKEKLRLDRKINRILIESQ